MEVSLADLPRQNRDIHAPEQDSRGTAALLRLKMHDE